MVKSPLFKCPYIFVCLFVCSLFVCLQCTRLCESMLMFMLEFLTTKETLGNSFINTETKLSDLPNLGNFAAFQV